MKILQVYLIFVLESLISGRPIPDGHPLQPTLGHYPNYEFGYAVHDGYTGDIKSQHEIRHGGNVEGHYSLIDPDGRKRVVEYHADDHNGFNAIVHHEGHGAVHHGHRALPPPPHHHHHSGGFVQVPVQPQPPPPPPPGPTNDHFEHQGGGPYNHHAHFAQNGPLFQPAPQFVEPIPHSHAFQHNHYFQPHH